MGSDPKPRTGPDFDRIAVLYRWLEYFSFGSLLTQCRFQQLPRIVDSRRALVLGDGDGRFLAKLVAGNPELSADVVDSSSRMLDLARGRVQQLGKTNGIYFYRMDIREFCPAAGVRYDLIVTHFFLDCLSEDEIEGLTTRLSPHLAPSAKWAVSEFAIPERGVARFFARVLVAVLYLAFRCLTGLQVQSLPDYGGILHRAGFVRQQQLFLMRGILCSELWIYRDPSQATKNGPLGSQ